MTSMKMDKDFHEVARIALARLFRDALELNDLQKTEESVRIESEEDIIEDYTAVADYIIYLTKLVEKIDDTQKEHTN